MSLKLQEKKDTEHRTQNTMHCALRSENLYINKLNFNLDLYDNCTLLHDSYESGLIIKFCFNKNLIKRCIVLIFFLIMLSWLLFISICSTWKIMSIITKIILTWSEDWEKWFWDLQANISKKIWSYINLNNNELTLLKLSRYSELADFNQNACLYVNLSAVQQRIYENVHQYYNQNMKYYSHQQNQLQTMWVYITFMIFQIKKFMLNSELIVWQ